MTSSSPLAALPSLFALALLGAGPSACVLDPIDYTGKACPCPDGWRCQAEVCVSSAGSSCTPRIVPTGFRVAWATPNSLRWSWDSAGNIDDFSAYRLVIGPSKQSVATGSGATVFTAEQNPELGMFNVLHTTVVDPVTATITDGLEPATTYHAKLVAVDSAGCEHASDVLTGKTSVGPSSTVPLFDGTEPLDADLIPAAGSFDPACPPGGPCLSFPNDCGEALCYQIMRLGVHLPASALSSSMTAGDFGSLAYLEMRVASDSTALGSWSEFRLQMGEEFYSVGAQTIRADGAYRTYQIPLRAFRHDTATAEALTYEVVSTAGLDEFGAGSEWSDLSQVWLGEAYVRW